MCVENDLKTLDKYLFDVFNDNETELSPQIKEYLFSGSKRVRSTLIFLFSRAIKNDVSRHQYNVATAIELIHNATLIHDDVIDSADVRRQMQTLNKKFDERLAVIAGDFMLTLALNSILKLNSTKIIGLFTESLKKMCVGEISQYFTKYKVSTVEEYIEKSKSKTARLFHVALCAAFIDTNDECLMNAIKDFAFNFGIAFQIRDDLINVLTFQHKNKTLEDIDEGIYTAPIIFACSKNPAIIDVSERENLQNNIKTSGAIEDTKKLLDVYIEKALNSLAFLKNSTYKEALISLCNLMRCN